MSGYSTKQRAEKWQEILPFLGQVYEPPDGYEGGSGPTITQQGTTIVRGPFATPRHTINVSVNRASQSNPWNPFSLEVRVGCDESGESAAATLRLRLVELPAIGQQKKASHLTGDKDRELVIELLDSAGDLVDEARVVSFPMPSTSQYLVTNNRCTPEAFTLRLAVSSDDGLKAESCLDMYFNRLNDAIESSAPPLETIHIWAPPVRHLYPKIEGVHDISRIAVHVQQLSQAEVNVVHRPLERSDVGDPAFFVVEQGGGCEESDEAIAAEKAGTKTLCTSWSRSCHVAHSREDACYTELDVHFAGDFQFNASDNAINSPDFTAALQGTFALGATNDSGQALHQNTFWLSDDEQVTVGNVIRKRIELCGYIGSYWPAPACIGDDLDRPVEVAVFGRAIVRATSGFVLPFLYQVNQDYPVFTTLRARLSQRLLLGEQCESDFDPLTVGGVYLPGKIRWDLRTPWGLSPGPWNTFQGAVYSGIISLTSCNFQLR